MVRPSNKAVVRAKRMNSTKRSIHPMILNTTFIRSGIGQGCGYADGTPVPGKQVCEEAAGCKKSVIPISIGAVDETDGDAR